jgi:hypothetical protein
VLTVLVVLPGNAKKIKTHGGSVKYDTNDANYTTGSFMVASECDDCNSGYHLSQVYFSGYDKTAGSDLETFFVTNNTDSEMSAISFYLEYLSTDGRQFHKRFLKLECDIPASETRKFDVKSWDKQHSFHYIDSNPGKNKTTPYRVRVIPVAYWLKFKEQNE